MDARKLGGLLVLVAVVGVSLWFRMGRRDDDSASVREDAMVLVRSMEEYEQNRALLDEMADQAHENAFSKAYSMGGRRSRAKFDDDVYIKAFFESMISQAERRQKKELALALRELHISVDAAMAGSGG
jgi:hypothetical protein